MKQAPIAPTNAGEVAEEWRLQAVRDLEVAKQLASSRYFEWAAYAAQQAAEKAVKAVRHALAIDTHADARLSHKLIELANPIVQAYETLLPGNAELASITQHEADGRYPGPRKGVYQAPLKAYDQPTAEQALLIADVIVERCSRLTLDLRAFWTACPVLPAVPSITTSTIAGTASAAGAAPLTEAPGSTTQAQNTGIQALNPTISASQITGVKASTPRKQPVVKGSRKKPSASGATKSSSRSQRVKPRP